jgi:hypothetical protein
MREPFLLFYAAIVVTVFLFAFVVGALFMITGGCRSRTVHKINSPKFGVASSPHTPAETAATAPVATLLPRNRAVL